MRGQFDYPGYCHDGGRRPAPRRQPPITGVGVVAAAMAAAVVALLTAALVVGGAR